MFLLVVCHAPNAEKEIQNEYLWVKFKQMNRLWVTFNQNDHLWVTSNIYVHPWVQPCYLSFEGY